MTSHQNDQPQTIIKMFTYKHTSLNVVNYVVPVPVFVGATCGAKLDIKRINESIILRTNPGHFSCIVNC